MPVKLIECPRDAMQGMLKFVETYKKKEYLRSLLQVGFDVLDCGSFVSPKVIPQMADTAEVLNDLDRADSGTKLLVIVANRQGIDQAVKHPEVDCVGFPFSVSETFQMRNTNSTIDGSFDTVKHLLETCHHHQKECVLYLSMAFGNPYNDFWDAAIVGHWADRLYDLGVRTFSLSDTVGVATPETIKQVFAEFEDGFPGAEFGAHFHTQPDNWQEKIEAAMQAGCMRYDGALKGYGGCPMAKDDLVGNMPTEKMIHYFADQNLLPKLDENALAHCLKLANEIFL
jgi:hydroxymethylglutaryl-CoA lyase